MLRLLVISGAALAFASPAFAADFTAKTSQTFETLQGIAADGAVWSCEGDTCIAKLKRSKVSVRGCKKAVRKLGELTSYGTESQALSEAELAECNTEAR